jgi:hypothetical protein
MKRLNSDGIKGATSGAWARTSGTRSGPKCDFLCQGRWPIPRDLAHSVAKGHRSARVLDRQSRFIS